MENLSIQPANGKLGILIVGLNGAVSTTFIAGVLNIRNGYAKPVGSLTQMQTIRLGSRIENNFPLIRDFVPLSSLDNLVFGGWDIRNETCLDSAMESKVLSEKDIFSVQKELDQISPFKGVFIQNYVKKLKGTYIKEGENKYALMLQIRDDIKNFKNTYNLSRVVVIWCGSTEIYIPISAVHKDIQSFEKGMKENHSDIAPSMLYAYAAVSEGVPYVNGSPNLSVDIPAVLHLAEKNNIPIAGKDFKTGQTLVKTVIAPMLKARMLGLNGWFSTNILGNRDGEVLDDPGSFKTKEESKLSVLDSILQPDLYPDLYSNYHHLVRINYYPPRDDSKEGWDNIDIFGWLNYPMQMKINFLCRDSILAAPIVLDIILFMDLAQRSGMKGIQHWLSFYFKSPMHDENTVPEQDLFIQLMKLKNTLRVLMGETPISHLNGEVSKFIENEIY
ncbi:MAG: inositol-3-phosphate synthase [Ignavibacteria bacterium CG_4_9_14_0_2_um_filter_37_13]|nr:MAG: inositol-3-phosphate synthase [Ignavibacteria bacterium CG_4_9_14_0_2_um_filter_37_13]